MPVSLFWAPKVDNYNGFFVLITQFEQRLLCHVRVCTRVLLQRICVSVSMCLYLCRQLKCTIKLFPCLCCCFSDTMCHNENYKLLSGIEAFLECSDEHLRVITFLEELKPQGWLSGSRYDCNYDWLSNMWELVEKHAFWYGEVWNYPCFNQLVFT